MAGTRGQFAASEDDQTQWSIIYDIKELTIKFKTLQSPAIKSLAISNIDFSCRKPTQVLDVNSPINGDVTTALGDYTDEIERSVVQKTSNAYAHLPPAAIDRIVAAAGASVCTEK